MLGAQKMTHLTHAVDNPAAAVAMYQDVFGGRVFYRGPLDPDDDPASVFLVLSSLCIKVESLTALRRRLGPLLLAPFEGYQAITLKVAGLDQAARHLESQGVRVPMRSPTRIYAHPEDTFGALFELRATEIPDDPRLAPGWSTDSRSLDHPIGFTEFWGVSLLVNNPLEAKRLYEEAFEAKHVAMREASEIARHMIHFTVGESPFAALEPASAESELAKVGERLAGGQGIHGATMVSTKMASLPRYFSSKGIGLLPSPRTRCQPHPRALMGARFVIVQDPPPGDPRWGHFGR